MRTGTAVIDELRGRGELWEPAPGLVTLRGDALRLRRLIERELAAVAALETDAEWLVPPAVTFATLARADYFSCFPQWLTATAHLDVDDVALQRVAADPDPATAATRALRPGTTALQPAVCYHVYQALAGTVLDGPQCCTVSGTCWRHERGRFAPLERGWAFTMREIVCAGATTDVASLRARGMAAATALAEQLGLSSRIEAATDPFFAPSTRGRSLLQRVKGLKHELLLPLGDGREVAAASFNDHAHFFGDAFDIRLDDGRPAATGCVAFGVERWLLATLVAHGTDPRDWPLRPLQTIEPGSS